MLSRALFILAVQVRPKTLSVGTEMYEKLTWTPLPSHAHCDDEYLSVFMDQTGNEWVIWWGTSAGISPWPQVRITFILDDVHHQIVS